MRDILLSSEVFPFMDEAGKDEIDSMRAERGPILARDRCPITRERNGLRLHTYSGGRVNATLAALLEARGVARIAGIGDLEVDLKAPLGSALWESRVRAELRAFRDVDARLSDADMTALVGRKNRGRLAKFQPYLPRDLEGSYLTKELFDFARTADLARCAKFPTV